MDNNSVMKRIVRAIRVVLSHLTMLFAILILVCFVIDRVNTAMEFMTSSLSKHCIAILAVLALITSLLNIISLWEVPGKKNKNKR